MATTRLMPLHTGKGRTVGIAIEAILDYVENPEKTEGGNLITSWQDYLDEKYRNGIEWIGTISCEEVNEEVGAVPETEAVVGKTFCYNNQYNGIRLVNNFYKVATDADGVYSTMDRWADITGQSEATTDDTEILPADGIAVPYADDVSVENTELVYVPIDATTYRLCYAVNLTDLTTYYVDTVTGETVELFVR